MGDIVLICGGRNFNSSSDGAFMHEVLHKELAGRDVELIVTGGASGADDMADILASNAGIQRVIVPANWNGRGKAAGMERNALMLKLFPVTLVIAFPGGVGTAGMVRLARAQGIFTIEYVNTLSEPYRA